MPHTKPEDRALLRGLIEASKLPIAVFAEWVLGADPGTAFRYLSEGEIPASRLNWLRRVQSVEHRDDQVYITLRWQHPNRRWWPWVEHGNKRSFMVEERGLAESRDYADVRAASAAASVSAKPLRSEIGASGSMADELANLEKVAAAVSAKWEITLAGAAALSDAELEDAEIKVWTERFARVAPPLEAVAPVRGDSELYTASL